MTHYEDNPIFSGIFCASNLNGSLYFRAPFSPGATIHTHIRIAQQISQDHRGLARPCTDGAIGDDATLRDHAALLARMGVLSANSMYLLP